MTKFIALISTLLILLAAFSGVSTETIKQNYYAMTTVVIQVDYENDIVTCKDFVGNSWAFNGCEDWISGDIASMIMDTKGTQEISDDEIVSVRYNGWIENFSKN